MITLQLSEAEYSKLIEIVSQAREFRNGEAEGYNVGPYTNREVAKKEFQLVDGLLKVLKTAVKK